LTRRYDHHIGGVDPLVGVVVFEPPLVADNLDNHRVRVASGEFEYRRNRWHRDRRQDQSRDDRPDHFELGVAMMLLRFLRIGLAPIAE